MASLLNLDGFKDAYDNLDTIKDAAGQVSAGFKKAQEFLATVFKNPYVQKASIVLGAILNGTNAVTGIHRFGASEGLNNVVATVGFVANQLVTAVSPEVWRATNILLDELKNPNVGGIPIHADSEMESHDSDVGQHLLIRQSRQTKEYVADNVVPKPISWTIKGYIMAARNNLDAALIIKPSLLMQRRMLQYYKDTRMPVVFKTHDNRFYTVLISHFDTSYTAQALNALAVNLTLTEFNAMTVDSEGIALNQKLADREE